MRTWKHRARNRSAKSSRVRKRPRNDTSVAVTFRVILSHCSAWTGFRTVRYENQSATHREAAAKLRLNDVQRKELLASHGAIYTSAEQSPLRCTSLRATRVHCAQQTPDARMGVEARLPRPNLNFRVPTPDATNSSTVTVTVTVTLPGGPLAVPVPIRAIPHSRRRRFRVHARGRCGGLEAHRRRLAPLGARDSAPGSPGRVPGSQWPHWQRPARGPLAPAWRRGPWCKRGADAAAASNTEVTHWHGPHPPA